MPLDFAPVAPVYDRLNDVISLGQHRRWKRRLVGTLLDLAGKGRWLDMAAGTGDVAELMVKSGVPEVIAADPCAPMVALGRERTSAGISWLIAPSEKIPLGDGTVRAIACSFGVRNFTDRGQAFREWNRVLEPGGVCGVLEMHPPAEGLFLGLFRFHWRWVMPLLGKLAGRGQEYRYLQESVEGFVSPRGLAEEALAAGLEPLGFSSLFGKGMVSLSLFRKHGGREKNSNDRGGDRLL